jgi:hypothetical protein
MRIARRRRRSRMPRISRMSVIRASVVVSFGCLFAVLFVVRWYYSLVLVLVLVLV